MVVDAPLLSRAFARAVTAHEGQRRKRTRKGAGDPYVVHPLRVVGRVHTWGLGADAELLAAAALHDVVEDTALTVEDVRAEFGARVALLVDALTHPAGLKPRERTRVILEKLGDAPLEAVVVKLADRLDNVHDMPDWRARARRGYLGEAVEIGELARERLENARDGSDAATALKRALTEYEPVIREHLAIAERDVAREGGG